MIDAPWLTPENNASHSSLSIASCLHCSTAIPAARRAADREQDRWFCCAGCEAVYEILRGAGLSQYYELRKVEGASAPVLPGSEEVTSSAFEGVDIAAHGRRELDFYLEGLQCLSCLWLVEKLPELDSGVKCARVDLSRGVVRIELHSSGTFSSACSWLKRLGYVPHPLLVADAETAIAQADNRSALIRLGVTGFAAGNIMLFTIALYAGADEPYASLFRWLCLGLAFPSFTWGAYPFYRSAWAGLRSRTVSIDLPIGLAIAVGGIHAAIQIPRGSNEFYLDSLSSLIFLLLGSRYVLRRLQQFQLGSAGSMAAYLPAMALRVLESGELQSVPVNELQPGQRVRVEAGSSVSVDGRVISDMAQLDLSVLTGESQEVVRRAGESVYAGTKNLGPQFDVWVDAAGEKTRMNRMASSLQVPINWKTRLTETADRVARWVLLAFVGVAVLLVVVLGNQGQAEEGLRRALTLLIGACPCALALATPMVLAFAVKRLAGQGVLVKDPGALETVSHARDVFLDKTGTLTWGRPTVEKWEFVALSSGGERAEIETAVYSLESQSRHPLGRALARFLESKAGVRLAEATECLEEPGRGISGKVNGVSWWVGRLPEVHRSRWQDTDDQTAVGVYRSENLVAVALLRDELRLEAARWIADLKQLGLKPRLLTGDRKAVADSVAFKVGLQRDEVEGECTPEQKAARVASVSNALMVGDGANDALALSKAGVGVSVQNALEVSIRAADVTLLRPGLEGVVRLVRDSQLLHRTHIQVIGISIAYNLVASGLAVLGKVGPLTAAVVMPVSAVTVLLWSAWKLRGVQGVQR